MKPNPKSVLVALVLPFVLMIAGVTILGPSEARVFGIPAIFVFMIVLFPTITGLMVLAWNVWDKHESYDDEIDPQEVAR